MVDELVFQDSNTLKLGVLNQGLPVFSLNKEV